MPAARALPALQRVVARARVAVVAAAEFAKDQAASGDLMSRLAWLDMEARLLAIEISIAGPATDSVAVQAPKKPAAKAA
jgi:hypothetical protein